jgi:ketosteroid isomerase-like protein
MSPAVLEEGAATFEKAVENLRRATDRFVNGDNIEWKAICSHQPDVSVAGRAGGFEVGWPAVEKRYDWILGQYVTGDVTYETTNSYVSGDLGFILEVVRGEVLLKGRHAPEHVEVRVTHILRREDGHWKLLHRHADNATDRHPLISQPPLNSDQ